MVIAMAAGLLGVPLADHALKFMIRRRLRTNSVALGPFGSLRVVESRIWLSRVAPRRHPMTMWMLWGVAAVLLAMACVVVPACRWFAGLLLGGSLSHAIEMSVSGGVSDYLCLRRWPAFNLADVAITAGSLGVVLGLLSAIKDVWS